MSFYEYERKFDDLPLLPADEQKELVRRAHAGDKAARDKMVLSNMRLVVKNIRPFLSMEHYDDLLHEGVIGLLIAIDRYDPDRGYNFSTYATQWIRQAVRLWVFGQNRVYIPRYVHDACQRLKKWQKAGITDRDELIQKAKLTEELYDFLIDYQQVRYIPLDTPVIAGNERSNMLLDLIPDDASEDDYAEVEERDEQNWKQEQVEHMLSFLPERQREIVKMAFGIGYRREMTLKEIAKQQDVSRARIEQILKTAERRLREANVVQAS